jgi:hypothetical protein
MALDELPHDSNTGIPIIQADIDNWLVQINGPIDNDAAVITGYM